MIGIYRIKNRINGECYYGSSKNIEKRWKDHKKQLRQNRHINKILQNAWNKHGEEEFLFEFVEKCDVNKLHEVEQKYLDLLPKYNIGLKACGGDNISKNPNKKNIIKNIKIGSKKWRDNLTPEERKIKFSKPLEKNPNWKEGISYVYCLCGKRIGVGHKHCNKCRPRKGKNNPFYGKKHSNENKIKFSKRMLGNVPKNKKTIIIDNIEYNSYKEASLKLNMPVVTIRWRTLSKNPKYKNYSIGGVIKKSYTHDEQKENLSKPQRGKQRTFNKPFLIDDIEYRTLAEASKKLNIHPMTIKGRLKSEKFDNYKYKN